MPRTFLEGVNRTLRLAGILSGESSELTSLTVSNFQPQIEDAKLAITEAIDDLFRRCAMPKPCGADEKTITLVAGKRAYSLDPSVARLHWPLKDRITNRDIQEWPGGYFEMQTVLQPESSQIGMPSHAAINPKDGRLFFDKEPTAADAGAVYTYFFERDILLEVETDLFPFPDNVWRDVMIMASENYRDTAFREFNDRKFNRARARAAQNLGHTTIRDRWA